MSFHVVSVRYPHAGLAGDPTVRVCVAPGACASASAPTPAAVGEVIRSVLGSTGVTVVALGAGYLGGQLLAKLLSGSTGGRR